MSVLSEAERERRVREWTDDKRCAACHETKPRHAFQASVGRRDGVYPYCRDCVNARMRAKYAADPEYRARQSARKATGKTAAEQEWRRDNPTCPSCDVEPRRVLASGTIGARCVTCDRNTRTTWRAALPQTRRAQMDRHERLRAWGITGDQYDAMLAKQGGGCAICGGLNSNGRRLAIDHDHSCCPRKKSCGKCIRGLLCSPCNVGIGSFADDAARMTRAIAYVQRG